MIDGLSRETRGINFLLRIVLIASIVALIWLIWMFGTSKEFGDCITSRKTSEAYRALHEQQSSSLRILIRLHLNSVCIAHTANAFNGAFTALGGFAVAGFTLALWRSSEKLWASAEKQRRCDAQSRTEDIIHLEKSLAAAKASAEAAKRTAESLAAGNRAFVSVNRHMFGTMPNGNIWIGPEWGNSGNTPTKDMRTHVRCELRDEPLPEDFNFDLATTDVYSGFIGPRNVIMGARLPLGGLSRMDIIAVQNKAKFLYLFGWVKYFDIFPDTEEHMTRICYCPTFVVDPRTGELINVLFDLCLNNNKAD